MQLDWVSCTELAQFQKTFLASTTPADIAQCTLYELYEPKHTEPTSLCVALNTLANVPVPCKSRLHDRANMLVSAVASLCRTRIKLLHADLGYATHQYRALDIFLHGPLTSRLLHE